MALETIPWFFLLGILALALSSFQWMRIRQRDTQLQILREALYQNNQGMALLSPSGAVRFWNRWLENLTGIPSARAIGLILTDIPPFTAEHTIIKMLSGVRERPLTHPLVFRTTLQKPESKVAMPIMVSLDRFAVLGKQDFLIILTLQDMTEAEELRERLQMALVKAESNVRKMTELDRMKSEFLAICSHELKTPLVSITGYLDLLTSEKFGPMNSKQQDALAVSIRNASRLNEILSSLLDFARMEAGKMRFEFTPQRLSTMLEEVAKILHPIASEKQVKLLLEIPADLPYVSMDSSLINRVLLNLLDNSIKFLGVGGEVIIRTWAEDSLVFVEISDNGPGIDPGKIARVKEPFYQADASNTRKTGGLGLGLAIVEKILMGHSSELDIHSVLGKGTRIRFTLKQAQRSPSGKFLAHPGSEAPIKKTSSGSENQ